MAYSEMSWTFFYALLAYGYAAYGDYEAAYCMGGEL